jgi:hypothetical protein
MSYFFSEKTYYDYEKKMQLIFKNHYNYHFVVDTSRLIIFKVAFPRSLPL